MSLSRGSRREATLTFPTPTAQAAAGLASSPRAWKPPRNCPPMGPRGKVPAWLCRRQDEGAMLGAPDAPLLSLGSGLLSREARAAAAPRSITSARQFHFHRNSYRGAHRGTERLGALPEVPQPETSRPGIQTLAWPTPAAPHAFHVVRSSDLSRCPCHGLWAASCGQNLAGALRMEEECEQCRGGLAAGAHSHACLCACSSTIWQKTVLPGWTPRLPGSSP